MNDLALQNQRDQPEPPTTSVTGQHVKHGSEGLRPCGHPCGVARGDPGRPAPLRRRARAASSFSHDRFASDPPTGGAAVSGLLPAAAREPPGTPAGSPSDPAQSPGATRTARRARPRRASKARRAVERGVGPRAIPGRRPRQKRTAAAPTRRAVPGSRTDRTARASCYRATDAPGATAPPRRPHSRSRSLTTGGRKTYRHSRSRRARAPAGTT